MAKAKKEIGSVLEDMHVALAEDLLKRIKNGTATAADLGVARQFLRDNNIDANFKNHAPLQELTEQVLPFPAKAAANE